MEQRLLEMAVKGEVVGIMHHDPRFLDANTLGSLALLANSPTPTNKYSNDPTRRRKSTKSKSSRVVSRETSQPKSILKPSSYGVKTQPPSPSMHSQQLNLKLHKLEMLHDSAAEPLRKTSSQCLKPPSSANKGNESQTTNTTPSTMGEHAHRDDSDLTVVRMEDIFFSDEEDGVKSPAGDQDFSEMLKKKIPRRQTP